MVPAFVVTAVMVASLVLVPDDGPPLRNGSASIAATEARAGGQGAGETRTETRSETRTQGTSRDQRRTTPGSGERRGPRLRARRAVGLDNPQLRRAVRVIHDRKVAAKRKARLKAQRLRRMARLAAMEKTSTFRVGALNILGSQHSAGPGGYGPGTDRAAMSSGIIMARGVDVVTLSEVQDDQLGVLNARLAGYSIWPQHTLGSNGQRLQIAWRSSRFEMLDGGSVTFTFASQSIPMPYVLLKDLETGAQFWVISIHTSAGGLEGERDAGTAIAISLMQRLVAETGKPVLIGGDVNEHEEFFYRVCGATGFLAANGGGSGCTLPPPPLRVDWIMGGGGNGVSFSGYVQDGSTLARASDHYFIHADVSVVDPGGTP